MLTFLLVYVMLDIYIKRIIPDKELRKKFKHQYEFYLTLAYFFAPLFLLQNEIIFIKYFAITFEESNILIFLSIIKIFLFIKAGLNFDVLFRNLRACKTS